MSFHGAPIFYNGNPHIVSVSNTLKFGINNFKDVNNADGIAEYWGFNGSNVISGQFTGNEMVDSHWNQNQVINNSNFIIIVTGKSSDTTAFLDLRNLLYILVSVDDAIYTYSRSRNTYDYTYWNSDSTLTETSSYQLSSVQNLDEGAILEVFNYNPNSSPPTIYPSTHRQIAYPNSVKFYGSSSRVRVANKRGTTRLSVNAENINKIITQRSGIIPGDDVEWTTFPTQIPVEYGSPTGNNLNEIWTIYGNPSPEITINYQNTQVPTVTDNIPIQGGEENA